MIDSELFTEYLVAERTRYQREERAWGLIAFKLAQLVWMQTDHKEKQPEISDYIPGIEKKPAQSEMDVMELCRLFNFARGGKDYEWGQSKEAVEAQKKAAVKKPVAKPVPKLGAKPSSGKPLLGIKRKK